MLSMIYIRTFPPIQFDFYVTGSGNILGEVKLSGGRQPHHHKTPVSKGSLSLDHIGW